MERIVFKCVQVEKFPNFRCVCVWVCVCVFLLVEMVKEQNCD